MVQRFAHLSPSHRQTAIERLATRKVGPESGLVTSLARPGGNVTGSSGFGIELVGKRLELLTQAVPGVGQVAVLWLPGVYGERTEKEMLTGAEVAARGLRVRLQFVEARRDPADLDRAFSDMTKARAGALTVLPSIVFQRAETPRGPGGQESPAGSVSVEGFCRCRGPHVLRSEPD
jgi:hypothetical protein